MSSFQLPSFDLKNLFGVQGKVALISGGSRGLGLYMAAALVRNGAKVYISSRKEKDCQKAVEYLNSIAKEGGSADYIAANLTTLGGCQDLAEELSKRENKLHILINNAGAAWGEPMEQLSDDGWNRCLELNLKGVFHLTNKSLDLLRNAATSEDPARIINVSSIAGQTITSSMVLAYSSSKAAVTHMSRIMAPELARQHITVNVIAPGMIPTKMSQGSIGLVGEEEFLKTIPLRRFGKPEDMASIALYLCSKASSWVTGSVFTLDGGASVATISRLQRFS